MPTYVRYKRDEKSFGEFILSDQIREPVAEVAKDIAKLAGKYAPRRKRGNAPDGTEMADRFRVNKDAGTIVVNTFPRVQVDVYNESRSAAPNEFGGKRNKRHRMLARAGAAFGDFKGEL